MDRVTELNLIDELLGLEQEDTAFLDEKVTQAPVVHYTDPAHFDKERKAIFRRTPLIGAHSSQLPEPGAFLRRDIAGLPVLLTRDRDGQAHAFLNVCRHRGARLVDEEAGCKHSFTCPYHAWTFSNQGDLRGVPHQKQGFPDLDKSALGLRRLPCTERHGFVWVIPEIDGEADFEAFLAPIAADLDWLDDGPKRVAHSDTIPCPANWKLLVEGGIEAYHFRVAHKDTIGPYFLDNLSSYQMMGPHIRSVLPRATISTLREAPRETWQIRDHCNVLYSIFPLNQLLVQHDHIAWVQLEPVSAGETLIRMMTLVPATSDAPDEHWMRNHQITHKTLSEDFEIGASIQAGLCSGANDHLTFGRYEGALDRFASTVAQRLAA